MSGTHRRSRCCEGLAALGDTWDSERSSNREKERGVFSAGEETSAGLRPMATSLGSEVRGTRAGRATGWETDCPHLAGPRSAQATQSLGFLAPEGASPGPGWGEGVGWGTGGQAEPLAGHGAMSSGSTSPPPARALSSASHASGHGVGQGLEGPAGRGHRERGGLGPWARSAPTVLSGARWADSGGCRRKDGHPRT